MRGMVVGEGGRSSGVLLYHSFKIGLRSLTESCVRDTTRNFKEGDTGIP